MIYLDFFKALVYTAVFSLLATPLDFKLAVGEACADALAPVQQRFNELIADKAYLEALMKKGSDEAAYYARKTLSKVKRKLGFVQ